MYNAKEFVQGLVDEYNVLIKGKDIQGVIDLHTSDALVAPFFPPFTPNTFFSKGTKDFDNFFITFAKSLEDVEFYTTEEVVQQGCILHEIGIAVPVGIRYYNRWAKEGGRWKIQYENPLFQPPQQN